MRPVSFPKRALAASLWALLISSGPGQGQRQSVVSGGLFASHPRILCDGGA